MNFNDLTVKLTSNTNYQSLQSNKQEQIQALIKGYESYVQNLTQSFYDNISKMQKEEQDRINNEKTWGTIFNFASLGKYQVVKGIVNGLTDFVTGSINIGTQLVNNIGQIIVQDGRFGGGMEGFFKELGSDLLYTVADPILSVAEGLTKGIWSVANIFGLDDTEFNFYLNSSTKSYADIRDWTLTLGERKNSFNPFKVGMEELSLNPKPSKEKVDKIETHTFDWARNFSTSVAQGGTWFKNNVSPVISKIISPEGVVIDNLEQNEVGEFFSGTMESIGRMIPAIVATYFGDSTALASAVSQIYFFSSSFGSGFSEAIERGATLEEAYTYAYGMASVETLTEQIGGIEIGKLLPGGGNLVMDIISAGVAEGMEEVMSEAMSAGLESIISDDPVSNADFMSRAMSSFLGGAISGGVFGSAGYYAHQKSTVGKVNSLNKEIRRIYEGQNQDYGKAQQVFNQKVDSLLNSYNRDSIIDNNLIEEGKRTPESRIQAKKDLLENSGFASLLIEYNEQNKNFQLTKKGIEMTTDLEGYMGDSNKNAYSSTLYGLEDTLATNVTNKELTSEQQDVMNLSKKLGSDVVFYTDSDTSINGFFKDGVVYINTESKKSPLINFIHELTHSLEGTKQYDTLKNFIMEISETNETLKAKMEELGLTKEGIVKDYWNQISKLKNIESKAYLMASEYVAFAMSEVILKDRASIESLTKNKTIGRKILNWIKEKIADIKTPKTDIEKAFLKDLKQAKDLYEEALGIGYRKGLKISEVDKRFSFIGEMGIENYITNEYIKDSGLESVAKGLKDAKKMFDDGFNNQEILEKTGWYFSKDGNWKFEISDKEASIKKEFEIKLNEIIENEGVYVFYLSEVLNNDKLYKLYPGLKRLPVYMTFEKDKDFYGYFSLGYENKIVLNIDALNKDKKSNIINDNLESYKKDLKILKEIRKVFDTDKNKAIELLVKLETWNNVLYGNMIFEKNKDDFAGSYDNGGLLVSFTRDIHGIDFLIKNTEINIKNQEELLKTTKKVDGENFILPTLLHEIQHYIQTAELWSDGGNLKDGFIYIIQDFLRKNKMVASFNEMSEYGREEFLFETFKNYPVFGQRFYNYLMFLGEVEARTVEKNRTLSQEEINNAKDISHEDNAIVKDSFIGDLNPLDRFYFSLAMKEMLLGFNEFERPNNSELENNKDIYDDELKKSLDNAIDFYNSDVRYSLKIGDNEVIVDTKSINNDLVALHNIGEDKLIKIIELGGFPMPSIAITKPNMNHEGYGDITVIFDKDTIDPKKTTKNKVWSGDKWTATFPQIEYEIDKEFIRKLGEETGLEVFDRYGDRVERMLKNYGLEGTVESITNNPDAKEYFEKNPPKNGLTVEEYLTEVIGNAILNTGIRNNVEIFTNAGNRRSFSQTHYTVSLENILKSMIRSETKKGVFYGGIGSMSASNMKNYRSINEIRKDIWKIVDENTTNAQKIELENQLLDVISDILDNKKYVDKNRFIALDNAEAILRELGGDGVNKTNIEKWYKEYEINGSEELTNKIINLFENLRNKYVRYFESKPERIVNFSEIKNVLVPEGTQQKLINLLNENNIPYEMYGEEGRRTHIENMKDIRFSKTIDSESRKLTVEQEKYFKDSKVRDEQGNLLVMYHGSSNADFNIFDINKIGENFPSYSVGGFYFTNKKQTAEYYGQKGHIKEVYLNLTNPYILKANEGWYDGSDWFDISSQQHYEQAIQNGNDGIIVEQKNGNMVLAFESNQIKNINNLNPTSSEDIRYSRSNLDIEISNEKIFSGNDERNMRVFTYGEGKGYDIDGGFISVIENSPYSPVNGNSIYDFFVNEEKRRKGIGTELFQKALKEFDGKLSGQFSSEQSVTIAWKNGLRNSEYKTLNEALRAMKENSSVFLEIGYGSPTNNVDTRFSRNVENGIDNNVEMEILDKVIKDTYQNYNKKSYLDTITKRQQSLNEINLKEIAKTTNGKKRVKVIETLMNDYERIIKKNYNRSELYNHIFNNVIQEIILELSNNFSDTTFVNKERVVDSIESIVSQTMAHIDNTFNNNDVNKLNPKNPEGFQYTRLINWGFRELLNATNVNERNAVLQSRKLSPLWDMIENIVKLDITDNQSILEFKAGIKNFFNKTSVKQVNSMALDSKGEFAHTIPVVLKQNDTHIENLTKLVGTMELQSKNGKKTTYKRTNGLLGDVRLFDKLSGTRLDMFAFGNIFGLFMENSTGSVMTKRIYEAQYQQLEVSNKFYEYFEKDGFLKKNRKNIDLLEKEVSTLTNLLDSNGNPIVIPNSQVIYLRDVVLREIVRDRMIENGYRGGEQSNYFKDGGFVFINGNSNNRKTNEANRVQAKINNVLDLFNELDSIVKGNKFMAEYNQKLLGFFELMYEFENARNKDISGLELTNDKDTIANLTKEQKAKLTSGLNDVNIDSIYVPMRSLGSNKSSGAGAFNINNVIDLGIDDGMVMGINESNNPPLIDSINNIIPQYTRSVANFYGLFRVVNDLNILFNKEITLSDGSRITLADKVAKISPYIIPYYEKLLRDISGYGVNSDITSEGFNRFMGKIRRNFFKASLGLNVKVILTQFASMFNISTIYGDFKGTKKSLMLSVMKNLFVKGSKTKAKYLIENSEIYKDRARNSTYEISEATSSAFNKSKFNEVTEFFMKGITVTDNMINRAFFISLVEHGYTEAQALKMTEEAITRYQSSGLSINKNELLRTQNELIRVFTKFLGEPMKVVSNMEESIKHLQIINRLEKNQEAINESFDNDLIESQKQVETLKQEKNAIEDLIENEKDKAKKKALEKTLKDIDKNIRVQEENVLEQEKNNAQIKKQVQGVIDGKANAKKVLGKRVTALMLSITWQTLLGVAFSSLRTGGSDKEEDEEVWNYLGKKFGWQLANEAVGYLPFVRDIYSLIVNKYDANVVSDFQAFNDLGSSISGILTDVTNGGDFNYGKHIRKVSIHLGQILGIPTRQIERLFTTPTRYFMKGTNYAYRDMTGQYTTNKELTDAIKNGDDKLIETILNRRLDSKGISLTNSVSKEINRLAKSGVVVNPSGIPNSFSIDGVEYKNDKDKFAETYNNATFVIEKIITQSGYKRLDDEYKAKLIKAIFTYYYNLAKQNVSGVQIFTKERTYNLNQAYKYFKDRIPYYMNQQKKEKKKREPN